MGIPISSFTLEEWVNLVGAVLVLITVLYLFINRYIKGD